MKRVTIIGGGVTGCTAAFEFSKKGWEVTIIEKNNYLGGGCRTFFYGGHPYTEGPRPLHVTSEKIFNYINDIVPLRQVYLYLNTYIEKDKQFYNYPIHMDDINKMPDKEKIMQELSDLPDIKKAKNFEEAWIASVGKTLYDKYVNMYTKKMWQVESNSVFEGFNWAVKGNVIQSGSKVLELQKGKLVHAYPIEKDGYNRYFEYCVKDSKVYLGVEVKKVDLDKKIVYIDNEEIKSDIIISTIGLDDLMEKCYGELKYMGREFLKIVLPIEYAFSKDSHFIYYPNDEQFTRIVEYKKLTFHKADSTLLVVEIPSHKNKLYTYEIKEEKDKAKKYLDNLPKGIFSIGRLAMYKYLTIGDCLEAVWDLTENI